MSKSQEDFDAIQLALDAATASTSPRLTNMPAKKPSPLDKIRAKTARKRAAHQVAIRDSAWHQIAVRNAEVAAPRKVVEETVSVPAVERKERKNEAAAKKSNKVTKPSSTTAAAAPRKTSSSAPVGIKRKASIAKVIKKEKPRPREEEILVSDYELDRTSNPEPDPPEQWTPAGGLVLEPSELPPSNILAIARIPGWRVENFSLALGELLLNLDIEDDFRIKVKTEDGDGLEKLTDVFVWFDGVDEAERARRKVDGKSLSGRILKVGFAKVEE